jgi:S1-C subfamily serine protease/regulator of sirC expression with transglutaminase-like and TPR domain
MPFRIRLPRRIVGPDRSNCEQIASTTLAAGAVLLSLCLMGRPGIAIAAPPEPPGAADVANPLRAEPIESIVQRCKPALVVITTTGRDGASRGLGTGFVVASDGLIATNLHVIGEARPISAQLADGRRFDVAAVHATDRAADLAVIRVAARDLPALALGDSDELRQGQEIIALGNPFGLRHSVVAGVMSARREIEGQKLIQLALPIEPGNSGGPLLDRQGRVHGVVAMKSSVGDNIAFAVEVNSLKPLLEKPNPVPIARWLTIGALDQKVWKPLFGATWRQRAGRISVEGSGQGFGGRSICLHQSKPPKIPFELAVSVKLEDESGAAGLVFAADGDQKHYGFYPTAGRLRLTRFEGPDVFAWHVLTEKSSPHYRPHDWNTLHVRLQKEKIICSINGHAVIELDQPALAPGAVGLAKFRNTKAQFKQFVFGESVPHEQRSLVDNGEAEKALSGLLDIPASAGPAHVQSLRLRAELLTRHAQQIRDAADQLHSRIVCDELGRLVKVEDAKIDLIRAALVISWLDNEELDVDAYVREVDRMAGEIKETLAANATAADRRAALDKYLFAENGFHGSRTEYYHRSNSYLNEVIDDREGLPITLSVLYMELGRRIGLRIEGVGLPSHFVVREVPEKGAPQLIDVFDSAKPLSRDEAAVLVGQNAGIPLRDEHLAPVGTRAILTRMLNNLLSLAQNDRDLPRMLRYLDALVVLDPKGGAARGMRALVRAESGRQAEALADLDWIIEHQPENIDLERVRQLRERISNTTK